MLALRRDDVTAPWLIGADMERGAGQQFGGATGLPPLAAIAVNEAMAGFEETGVMVDRPVAIRIEQV